jgi:hypothetical protein
LEEDLAKKTKKIYELKQTLKAKDKTHLELIKYAKEGNEALAKLKEKLK